MRDPAAQPDSETGRIEVKNTTCYMCACRCGIRVTLRDGEVRYIEGNPDHPLNKGVICAKGASGIMKQYSPGRLTKPLLRKRKALRGEGKFDEISWEQAFDVLATRLKKIRAEDPKQFALFTGRDQMQALTGQPTRIPIAFGIHRMCYAQKTPYPTARHAAARHPAR